MFLSADYHVICSTRRSTNQLGPNQRVSHAAHTAFNYGALNLLYCIDDALVLAAEVRQLTVNAVTAWPLDPGGAAAQSGSA